MDEVNNCQRHRPMTEAAAKGAARVLRTKKRFKGITAFKCKTSTDGHWHVGRSRRR